MTATLLYNEFIESRYKEGMDMQADLLIINGKCYDPDSNETYSWIAINKDRIIGIGKGDSYMPFVENCGEIIDAKHNSVLPGFIDSHCHMVQTAINDVSLNLSEAESFDDIGDFIRTQARKEPGKPIRGIRLDELKLKEKKLPDRYILDRFCDDAPVWINRIEYRTSILNTYALLHYKIPYSVAGIELDNKKMPTGIIEGNANALLRENILNGISSEYKLNALKGVIPGFMSAGVTTAASMEGGYMFCDKDAEFIHKYHNAVPIDLLLYFQTTDIKKVKNMGLGRIGGSLFIDGSFGSRNAALYEDYTDQPGNNGLLYFTQEELNRFLLDCYKNNLQTAVHVIGERAIDLALNAHEYAFKKTGNSGLRHRLEHVELATASHLKRSRELNLIYSMQPAYEHFWGGPDKMYQKRLGDRYKITNPLREILDEGILICGSSESDVTPVNPLLGIHSAVNHPVEKHRVSVPEAIRMFTIDGAFALGEDQLKGSIAVGKMADLVILSEDLLKIESGRIIDVKVKATIKSGNVLFNEIKRGR